MEPVDMSFTNKDFEDARKLQLAWHQKYTANDWAGPVGGYRMGDHSLRGSITFNLSTKPRWIHRMGVRLVLGWKWVDA
jgi:hypothetical protein